MQRARRSFHASFPQQQLVAANVVMKFFSFFFCCCERALSMSYVV
jgi:hypothetical protein